MKTVQPQDINYLQTVQELIDQMNPKPGWNLPCVSMKAGAGYIELRDGRIAEIQIVIETDEDEFMSDPNQPTPNINPSTLQPLNPTQ